MKTLNDDEQAMVLGALDSLGVALADKGHTWSTGERAIYEEAVKVLDGTPREQIPAGLPKCPKCNWHHAPDDCCV